VARRGRQPQQTLPAAPPTGGAKVGLIDGDILNPNLPYHDGLSGQRRRDGKMIPMEAYGFKVMSTGSSPAPG